MSYMSTKRAAEYADVHPQTIRKWIAEGHLRKHFAGRCIRVKREELDAYLSRNVDADEESVDERVMQLVP